MVLLKQGQVNSMLKFDKEGLANELLKNLKLELQWVLQAWEGNVIKYMRYTEFQKNANLDFKSKIQKETNTLIAYLEANTYVLADSYGTGSLALTSNPGYQKYRNNVGDNEGQWNPARKTRAIEGRPLGHYTDIFGKEHDSTGAYEGENLEGKIITKDVAGTIIHLKVEPVAPSYALQLAEQWLYKTYLPQAYTNAVNKTNFAKFLKEID